MDMGKSSSDTVLSIIIVESDHQILVNFSRTGRAQSTRSTKSIVILFVPRLILVVFLQVIEYNGVLIASGFTGARAPTIQSWR